MRSFRSGTNKLEVTEKMKADRKKHAEEQRARAATSATPEAYEIEDLEQEFAEEPNLS